MSNSEGGEHDFKIIEKDNSKIFTAEHVLKKRNREIKNAEEKAHQKLAAKDKSKKKLTETYKRPEDFVKEYRNQQKSYSDLKKRAKKQIKTEDDLGKVLLLVRTRGIKNVAPQCKKILDKLRLRYLYSASFAKVTPKLMNMIKKVEPYITYGIPSRKIISELIFKRAYGKTQGKRVALSSNQIVEEALGDSGLICIEDLVHEIATCGELFDVANNFIWNFKLTEPKEGLKNRNHPYKNGGCWGNREEKINEFVEKMIQQ